MKFKMTKVEVKKGVKILYKKIKIYLGTLEKRGEFGRKINQQSINCEEFKKNSF